MTRATPSGASSPPKAPPSVAEEQSSQVLGYATARSSSPAKLSSLFLLFPPPPPVTVNLADKATRREKVDLTRPTSAGAFALRQRIPKDCDVGIYVTAEAVEADSSGTMNANILVLLSGFLIRCSCGGFINVDTSLDPQSVAQNQVFLNRKEKFIKFDTKDNNLEIELGISVPFIEVPLAASRDVSEAKQSKITVNVPGVFVAGMLMLTSFLVIPLLFGTTGDHGFGFQRKGNGDVWSLVEGVNDALLRNGIEATSCLRKSICWMASSGGGDGNSVAEWVERLGKNRWVSRLLSGTLMEEAMKAASNGTSCGAAYSGCSLSGKHVQALARLVSSGQQ